MKGYRLVRELEDRFIVHDGDSEFPVAKGRLAHSTVNRIRQHFSEGGEVPGHPNPDAASNPYGPDSKTASGNRDHGYPVAADTTPRRSFTSRFADQSRDNVEDRRGHLTFGEVRAKLTGYPGPVSFSDGGEVPPDWPASDDPFALLGVPPPPAGSPQAPTPSGAIPAQLPPDLQALHAPFIPPAQPESAGPAFHDIRAEGAPQPAAPPPAPTAPPDPTAQIASATQQGASALQAKGTAEAEGFANIARQQEQAATHLQAMQADSQKMLAERTAREDQIFNDVQNATVDPGRWWASHSTAQKVSASIGLILGGIGAGLTKGPNYAVEMLNKHIDRDMEAQRLNIGKSQNLLSHYMAQTRDLVSAQHLAKADYLTGVAAQIAAATSKTSGAVALPAAQAAIAQLRVQAAAEGQQATLRSLQIKESQLGVQYRTAQMGVFSRAMQQAGAPGTTGGISIHPAEEMLLPKEMQDTLVRLPSGKVDFARTPKDAEEVKKTTEATDVLRKKLQRYGALRAAHPNGISRVLSPADYEAAQGLHESILTDLNGLAGLNRFTHEEAQVFGQRIPDITSLGRAAGRAAKLDELGTEIDDKVRATNRTYLRFSGPR